MGVLNESNRTRLDGIVQKMIANKESDANIQFVVDDFKTKYSEQETPTETKQTVQTKELIQPTSGGTMVQNIMQKATLPTKSEYGVENENPIDRDIRLAKEAQKKVDEQMTTVEDKYYDIDARKRFADFQKQQQNDFTPEEFESAYQNWKVNDYKRVKATSADRKELDNSNVPDLLKSTIEGLKSVNVINTPNVEKELNPLLAAKKEVNNNIQRLENIKTNYSVANEIEKKVGKPIETMSFDEITNEVKPTEDKSGNYTQLKEFNETAQKSYSLIADKLEYLQKQNEGTKATVIDLKTQIDNEQDPNRKNELISKYNEIINTPSIKEELALTERVKSFPNEIKTKLKENVLLDATNTMVEDKSKDKSTMQKILDVPQSTVSKLVGGALTIPKSISKALGADDSFIFDYITKPIGDFGENLINSADLLNSPTDKANTKSFYKVTDYKGHKLLIQDVKAYSLRDNNLKEVEDTDNIVAEWNNLPKDQKTEVVNKFNPVSTLYGTAQVVSDMIPLIVGGEVAQGDKALAYASGLSTIIAQTHNSIYDQVKDNPNLTEAQKNQYALGVATAIGVLNLKLGPEERLLGLENKELGTALKQTISDNVVNVANGKVTPMSVAMEFVKKSLKNVGKEVPQEFTEEIFLEPMLQNAVNGIVNKATGANIENQKIDIESIKEQALPIILSTGILGSVGSYKGKNQLQQDALWSAVNDIDKFREITASQIQSGQLKEDVGTKTLQTVEKVSNTLAEAPNLTETEKYNVGNLMFHNEQLNTKLESNIADVLKDKIKARIKDNNDLIGKLIGGEKLTTDEVINNNLEDENTQNTTDETEVVEQTTNTVNEVAPVNDIVQLEKQIKVAELKGQNTGELELQLELLKNKQDAIQEQTPIQDVPIDRSQEQKGGQETNVELSKLENSNQGLQEVAPTRQEEIKVDNNVSLMNEGNKSETIDNTQEVVSETRPITNESEINKIQQDENQKNENGIQVGGNEGEKNVPESLQSQGSQGGEQINIQTPSELLVENKTDAVTSAPTKELTPEQQKHNRLATLKNEFNALTVSQRNSKKGKDILQKINPLARELGYTQGMNKSKLQILGKTGKDIKNISIKEEKPLSSQEDIDYALGEIGKGRLEWDGDMMSFRPNLGIAWSDIRKGQKDLLEGKTDTLPAKRLVEALAKVRENGGYEIIAGSGKLTTTVFVPLNSWDEVELTKEEEDSILADQARLEQEANDLFDTLDLETQNKLFNGEDIIAEGEVGITTTNTENQDNVASEKTSKGKDKIAEGLDDIASIIGAKLSIVETNAKLGDALRKIGEGLIEQGLATAENVFEKVKEYVQNKFADKVNVEDYKDIIEQKVIKQDTRTDTPQSQLSKYDKLKNLAQEFLASGDNKEQVKSLIDNGDDKFISDNITDAIDNVDKTEKDFPPDEKERAFARAIPDVDEAIDALVTEKNYIPTNNKSQDQQADAFIAEHGVAEATSKLLSNQLGNLTDDVINVIAQKLIRLNNKNKNYAKSAEILDIVMTNLTEAGRLIQTATLWNLMTPEGVTLFEKRLIENGRTKFKGEIDEKMKTIEQKLDRIVKEINESPELKAQVSRLFKTERVQGKARSAKAIEWLDSIKLKGVALSAIPGVNLLPATYNASIEIIKTGIKAGVAINKVLDGAIKYIKENLSENDKFDENSYRKYFTDKLPKVQKDGLSQAEKEMGATISQIVKEHFSITDKYKEGLVKNLVEKAGLNEEEANRTRQIIEAQFDKKATKNLTKELANKQDYQKPLEKIKEGKLAKDDVKEILYSQIGLDNLSAEDIKIIEEMHQKVIDAPEGSSEQKDRLQDLMGHLEARTGGLSNYSIMKSLLYASILSGTKTQLKNIISNTMQTAVDLLTNTIYEGVVNKDLTAMASLIHNLLEGYKRGVLEAGKTITTGYDPNKTFLTLDSNPKIGKIDPLENKAISEKTLFKGGNLNPLNAAKFVKRFMVAADTLSYYGLKEMESGLLARRLAIEKGLSGKELQDEVNEILKRNDEFVEKFTRQAHSEGLINPKSVKRRVFELIEQNRPTDITDRADKFALKATYNNEPTGTMGAISKTVSGAVQGLENKNKVLGAIATTIAPFTRVIANVINEQLNLTPIGIARGMSKKGNLFPDKANDYISSEERAKLLIKGITGTLLMTAFILKGLRADDDDDPTFEITANGYGNSQDNAKLYDRGWQPYTIKVGDLRYNYQNTPMGQMLGVVGTVLDNHKYNNDKNLSEKAGLLGMAGINQILNASALQGMSQLFDAIGGANSENQNKIIATIMDKPKMLIPNIFKEAQKIVDNKLYDKSDFKGILIYNVPIAQSLGKPKLNVWGDEIEVSKYNIITNPNKIQTSIDLAKKGIEPSMPSHATKINGQVMNDEQFYEFAKLRGKYLKQYVAERMDDIMSADNGIADKIYQDQQDLATKNAKFDILDKYPESFK